MPWVIWDILVPMLATFLIGLATGWLLWRWRRQKVTVAAANELVMTPPLQETDDSANVVLIEERDSALARADAAEAEVESLKGQIDLSVMGVSDSQATQNLMADSSETDKAEVEALTRELEKEKASKAEVERSLVDLNTRYKDLSVRLEEEVSTDGADTLKEAAALESNFEQAKVTIAEQSVKLKKLEENEQAVVQKYEQEIAVKDAQLTQERTEREEVRMQLARAKLANEKTSGDAAAKPDEPAHNSANAAVSGQNQPNKVHRLTGYPAGSGNEETLAETSTPNEAPRVKNATESSNDSAGSQAETSPDQMARGNSDSPQSPANSTGHAGMTLSSTATHGSAARAEFTPVIETENLDEPLQEVATAEPVIVEDDIQDQTASEPATESDSAQRSTAGVAPQTQQNVTSIKVVPRKSSEKTQQFANATASKRPASRKRKGTSNGYVPTAWSVPEKAPLKAERDDLQEIKGVGPVLEKMLHKTGIYHFRQVALLDKKGVQELDDQLPQFSGRIQREKWVGQAKALHRSKYGSAAK